MTLLTTTLILSLLGADPGATVFPLMKIGQGPRAAAMGECFTGLADDASAIYWNPAGLGQLKGHHFALSHQEWFLGIRDEVGHAALPLGEGTFGLGLVYTGDPNVRYWDPEGEVFEEFNSWNGMLTAGYGFNIDNYELGASVTGVYQDLLTETGMAGAIDVGGVGHYVDDALTVGVALRHLGVMSLPGGMEYLPMEAALGAAYKMDNMFRFTFDAVVPVFDNNPNFRAGFEFSPIDLLALRVGYRTGPVDLSGLGYLAGLTGGLGVTLGNFGVDYAFVPYGELGLTHRIGIRTVVPPPTTGGLGVVVLDDETGMPLAANVAVSGAYDSTVTTSEVTINRVEPGEVKVGASLEDYTPASKTLTVVAGQWTRDTLRLRQLLGRIVGGIYNAKTKEPIGGTIEYAGRNSGTLPVSVDPGTYEIAGLKRGSYDLDAVGPSDEFLSQTVTVDVPAGETVEKDFYLWKKGDLLSLMVNFETAKANILAEFDADIDRAGAVIKQTPQIQLIELSGHTDPRKISTAEFPSNWELSKARADAVKQYLVDKFGIDPNRLVTVGHADTKPLVPNTSPENMYKNRRTELKILK
jgi:outer membrane protein OmpA-like peptidoglycan-associated protein